MGGSKHSATTPQSSAARECRSSPEKHASQNEKRSKSSLSQKGTAREHPDDDMVFKYAGRPAMSLYITSRCQNLQGQTVSQALSAFRYKDGYGKWCKYSAADLRYDLASGRVFLEKRTLPAKVTHRLRGKQ